MENQRIYADYSILVMLKWWNITDSYDLFMENFVCYLFFLHCYNSNLHLFLLLIYSLPKITSKHLYSLQMSLMNPLSTSKSTELPFNIIYIALVQLTFSELMYGHLDNAKYVISSVYCLDIRCTASRLHEEWKSRLNIFILCKWLSWIVYLLLYALRYHEILKTQYRQLWQLKVGC